MENKKINFFSRIKKAVIKFDDYEFFINEKLSISIKYMFKLILIMALIVSIALSYVVIMQLNHIYYNISNNIPDFKFEDYQITANEIKEYVDEENDLYFSIDTSEVEKEKLDSYKEKINEHSIGILILKDKIIYKSNQVLEYTYKDLMGIYDIQDINFTKSEAIDYINQNVMGMKLYVVIFLSVYITFFIATIISVLSDAILLWLLGMITSRLAKLNIGYTGLLSIAIYSLTLPLILLTIYDVVSTITTFRIDYFNIIYISIAYIYVIAAILMIKSDMIKQNVELTKIVEVQEKLKEEMEEKKETEEEKKDNEDNKENKKDDENEGTDLNNDEPEGSEI